MPYRQRNNPRYAVKDWEIVVMGTLSNIEAAVRDIGLGGMKLQYMSEIDRSDQWTQINIISGNRDLILLADVRCTVAYDIKGLMENGTYRGMDVRLCGLCFGQLTEDQRIALQILLDCYSA